MFALKIFKVKRKKKQGQWSHFVAGVDVKNKKIFCRSSLLDVFCKKCPLKYLAKLAGKHIYRSWGSHVNKRGIQIKSGGQNVLGQKRQSVITNYGCPKQPVTVKKHQYNSSSSLHLYIKQNRTFLITNLSNVNTKSCLRNQTRLCIHLLVLLVPSHWHIVFGIPCLEQSVLTISEISAKQNLEN